MKKTARKILSLCIVAAMVLGMSATAFGASAKTYELKEYDNSVRGTITITDVISDDGKPVNDAAGPKIKVTTNSLITYNFVMSGIIIIWGDELSAGSWQEEELSKVVKITNAKVLNPELNAEIPDYEKGYTIQFINPGVYEAHIGFPGYIGYPVTFEVADAANAPAEPTAPVAPTAPTAPPAKDTVISAAPTSSTVLVNGTATDFEAYNISGNNYFKLRDVAKVVSGSEKQFEVSWDAEKKAINLVSGQAYTAVGGELAKGDGRAKTAKDGSSAIYKDGTEISLTAYNINGNNYFKLRDLGQAFDFGVSWDAANKAVVIDTSTGYTAE